MLLQGDGLYQRGKAGVHAGARFAIERQQLAIAPGDFVARCDLFAPDGFSDWVVIVYYLKWTEAGLTDMQRFLG